MKTTWLAAAAALSFAGGALAQSQPAPDQMAPAPLGTTRAEQAAGMTVLRDGTERLRALRPRLEGTPSMEVRRETLAEVDRLVQATAQAPTERQTDRRWIAAQRELGEARAALRTDDGVGAGKAIDELLAALEPLQQEAVALGAGPPAAAPATVQPQAGEVQGRAGQGAGAPAAIPPAQGAGPQGVALSGVQGLIGTTLVGADGRDAGRVENLLVDGAGQVRGAVVEWGGFLGLGERRAVVPIGRIEPAANGGARLGMTRQELEALPRFERALLADFAREQGWGEGVRLAR